MKATHTLYVQNARRRHHASLIGDTVAIQTQSETGAIKIVMTGAASDPPAWQTHIGKRPKARVVAEIRLSTRLAGCGGAECIAASRGIIGGMGGLTCGPYRR
jgi:hypothetical protein